MQSYAEYFTRGEEPARLVEGNTAHFIREKDVGRAQKSLEQKEEILTRKWY